MCRLAECDVVHVDPFFGNIQKSEHKEQIVPAIVTDLDRAVMCGQLLEFAETA